MSKKKHAKKNNVWKEEISKRKRMTPRSSPQEVHTSDSTRSWTAVCPGKYHPNSWRSIPSSVPKEISGTYVAAFLWFMMPLDHVLYFETWTCITRSAPSPLKFQCGFMPHISFLYLEKSKRVHLSGGNCKGDVLLMLSWFPNVMAAQNHIKQWTTHTTIGGHNLKKRDTGVPALILYCWNFLFYLQNIKEYNFPALQEG